MADKMAAELAVRLFPSAERGGRGWQAGVHPEIVEQPVRVEFMEVLPIPLHRLSKRSVEKADILEGKRASDESHDRPHFLDTPLLSRFASGLDKNYQAQENPG
jgi:hypothetical protein